MPDVNELYRPGGIRPISFLKELRGEVLKRSDKRMPKWKFRIAPDLLMMLQPQTKVVNYGKDLRLFVGNALQAEGATKEMLEKSHGLRPPYWSTKFVIDTGLVTQGLWTVVQHGWSRSGGAGQEGTERLERRVIATFRDGFFDQLTVSPLLSDHCLICGKALTDPASRARFVGPECAGTSTLRVPWVVGGGGKHDREIADQSTA
jgi:hypothetical protein